MTETPSVIPYFHDFVCESALVNTTYHETTSWLFRHILSDVISWLLELEITAFLHTAPLDTINNHQGRMRNGYYKRRLETRYGILALKIPGDQSGSFKQQTVPFYCRSTFAIEHLIFPLMNSECSLPEQLSTTQALRNSLSTFDAVLI